MYISNNIHASQKYSSIKHGEEIHNNIHRSNNIVHTSAKIYWHGVAWANPEAW